MLFRSPDRDGVVLPLLRSPAHERASAAIDGTPDRPRAERQRRPLDALVPHAERRGVADAELGARLVLLATHERGYRALARLLSAANLAASKGVSRLTHALLEAHLLERPNELLVVAPFEEGEIARRLAIGDRAGARAAAERLLALGCDLRLELVDRALPGDAWIARELRALAQELGVPLVASAAPRSAAAEERELLDVLTAIRHGVAIPRLGPLRFHRAETHLRSGADLARTHPEWSVAIAESAAIAARADLHLDFVRVRFAGIDLPDRKITRLNSSH